MSETTLDRVEEEVRPTGGHSHLGWALVIISIAQLMVVLDSTIANIALPYIQETLTISDANLTWIVTGYALAFGGLLLLGGRLGDLYGRRRVFVVGLVVFAVASLLGGVASSELTLLAARGLQGVGAALAAPAALALITTTFPAGPARNRAFAVYAAMSGVGAAVGLILGGWLTGSGFELFGTEVHGWRLTFLINVPIGLVAAYVAPRVLAESDPHESPLDVPGAITGTLGLLSLVYGLTRAGDQAHGWGDTWTIAALVAGGVLLGIFAAVESRVEHPLLPVRVFRNRTRAASFVAMMLMPAAMFAMFFFLSLFIQNVMGYSPMEAGLAFLPFSFGIVIAATISSQLASKVDPRFLAGSGTLVAAFALFMFSRITVDDSAANLLAIAGGEGSLGEGVNYWTQIFPFIVIMSLGMGLTFVPLTLTAVHHIRAEDSGIGSGVLNTMQQVGGALGLATLGTVASHFTANRAEDIAGSLPAPAGGATPDPGVMARLQEQIGLAAFTEGGTNAFLVGAGMILVASLVIWTLLDVKHEELATDGPEAGVHVG